MKTIKPDEINSYIFEFGLIFKGFQTRMYEVGFIFKVFQNNNNQHFMVFIDSSMMFHRF